MTRPKPPIQMIVGAEPLRAGENPRFYCVGQASGFNTGNWPVKSITYRVDDYGDHGLGWYDVWSHDSLIASVAARAVAEVIYHYGGTNVD